MIIRKAKLMDAVEIVKLWELMIDEVESLKIKQSDRNIFMIHLINHLSSASGVILVVENDEKIIGFLNARAVDDDYSKTKIIGFCEHIYVLPDYRSDAVFEKIMLQGIHAVREFGAREVQFQCGDNDVLKRLYESKGFKISQYIFRKEI